MKKTKNTSRILSYVFKLALPLGIVAPLVVSCKSTQSKPLNPEVDLVVKHNLKASDFQWENKKVEQVKEFITKDWIFLNKDKLFENSNLLKAKENIFNLNILLNDKLGEIIIKFDHNNDLNNNILQFVSIKIVGFSLLNENPIVQKNNLKASDFSWENKKSYEVAPQIDSNWVFENRDKIFDNYELLQNKSLISSVKTVRSDAAKKLTIEVTIIKVQNYNEKIVKVDIVGFLPLDELVVKFDLSASDFNWENISSDNVPYFDSRKFIFENKDKIFEDPSFLESDTQINEWWRPEPKNQGKSLEITFKIKYRSGKYTNETKKIIVLINGFKGW